MARDLATIDCLRMSASGMQMVASTKFVFVPTFAPRRHANLRSVLEVTADPSRSIATPALPASTLGAIFERDAIVGSAGSRI